eukprot:14128774-Alexandrium_andersonii.AAC.1
MRLPRASQAPRACNASAPRLLDPIRLRCVYPAPPGHSSACKGIGQCIGVLVYRVAMRLLRQP